MTLSISTNLLQRVAGPNGTSITQTNWPAPPTIYDKLPGWLDLSSEPLSNERFRQISAATVEALTIAAVTSSKISERAALAILNCWKVADIPLMHHIAAKAELSAYTIGTLAVDAPLNILKILASRPDLSGEQLHLLTEQAKYRLLEHSDDICILILMHKNVRSDTISLLATQCTHRNMHLIQTIPRDVQDRVIDCRSTKSKIALLYHQSFVPELFGKLIDKLLEDRTAEAVGAAILHPLFPRQRICELAVGDDLTLAGFASERLPEVASLVSIKQYSRLHFGSAGPRVCKYLTERVNAGFGLGHFVAGCFFARPAYRTNPQALLEFFDVHAMQLNRPGQLLSIFCFCRAGQTKIRDFLLKMPPDAYRRMLTASLVKGEIDDRLLASMLSLANLLAVDNAIASFKWRRVRTLSQLIEKLRIDVELKGRKSKRIKLPEWCAHLPSHLVVPDVGVYQIGVARTTRAVNMIGIKHSNCLGTHNYAAKCDGKNIILTISTGRTIHYAAYIQAGELREIAGKYNARPPAALVGALRIVIRDAVVAYMSSIPPEDVAALAALFGAALAANHVAPPVEAAGGDEII